MIVIKDTTVYSICCFPVLAEIITKAEIYILILTTNFNVLLIMIYGGCNEDGVVWRSSEGV